MSDTMVENAATDDSALASNRAGRSARLRQQLHITRSQLPIQRCPACKTECMESYGLYRCENCGYCFTKKVHGAVKITVRPMRDALPTYIFYFFIAMLILSGLMKEELFIGISAAGIFVCGIIDTAVSFYNLRRYGYIIERRAILRKEDGAVWPLAFYTAVFVLFIGIVVYALMT